MKDIFDIKGKHIFISGASSGFGAHFAKVFAARGANVTAGARRADRLSSLVQEIKDGGGNANAVALDVASDDSVKAAFAESVKVYGAPNVIFNNAGIGTGGPAEKISSEQYSQLMEVNLKGAWRVATEAARYMISAEKGGSIINTASILGQRVGAGSSIYSISKAGVVQMTKAFALDWSRYKIRVNAIQPGYFKTELNADFLESDMGAKVIKGIPFRRTGELHELEGVMLLLASEASSFMTGSVISIDGGHLISSL